MNTTSIIGNLAAVLTTMSFLPQAVKVIRIGNTRQLSLPMYLMFVIGVACWIIYGVRNQQWPIIIGNSITLIFSGVILGYKLRETWMDRNGRSYF